MSPELRKFIPIMRCEIVLWKQLQRRAWDGLATANELNELALAYDSGRGCRQNDLLAFKYMLAAADKGSVVAMATVATVIEKRSSPENAHQWWSKAANAGLAEAQRKMGTACIANGNVRKAVYWFALSSTNGDAIAQSRLININVCSPTATTKPAMKL